MIERNEVYEVFSAPWEEKYAYFHKIYAVSDSRVGDCPGGANGLQKVDRTFVLVRNVQTGSERLIGERGTAKEWLRPEGYVQVQGHLWRAVAEPKDQPISPESPIRIVSADGLTLTVSKISINDDLPPITTGKREVFTVLHTPKNVPEVRTAADLE